jgi:hypothetical protein
MSWCAAVLGLENVPPDLLRSLLNSEKRYLAQRVLVQHNESSAGW